MLQVRWIILLTGLSFCLAACGTKGALFLPPKQPPPTTQTNAADKPTPTSAQDTKGNTD